MSQPTTRRAALTGAIALSALSASTATAAPASPSAASDATLVARIEQFKAFHAVAGAAWRAYHSIRDSIEEMPDCPAPGDSEWHEFHEAHGGGDAYDKANDLDKRMGAAVQLIMATPARTVAGVLAKLQIVPIAYGWGDSGQESDERLMAWQERNWLAAVTAELAQLVAGMDGGAA